MSDKTRGYRIAYVREELLLAVLNIALGTEKSQHRRLSLPRLRDLPADTRVEHVYNEHDHRGLAVVLSSTEWTLEEYGQEIPKLDARPLEWEAIPVFIPGDAIAAIYDPVTGSYRVAMGDTSPPIVGQIPFKLLEDMPPPGRFTPPEI